MYEEATKKAAAEWGKGWMMLSEDQQKAFIAAKLLDAMNAAAVYATGDEFKAEFQAAVKAWNHA